MGLTGKLSAAVIIMVFIASLFSPVLVPYDPNSIDLDQIKHPPSAQHLLGTDNKGRDILSRTLQGGKISIGISVLAVLISMSAGLTIGLVSGYFGGKTDTVFMSFVDLVLAFPALLLAIGISVLFPPGVLTVVIALSAVGWASFARLIRGNVLSLRESVFLDAAKAIGCSNARVLFIHVLPQCFPLAFAMAGLKLGGYILTEAALSFLGLGVQPPDASWGSMISTGRVFIRSAPWMVFPPGLMIAVTALCFNLLGDALRDKYDPARTGHY